MAGRRGLSDRLYDENGKQVVQPAKITFEKVDLPESSIPRSFGTTTKPANTGSGFTTPKVELPAVSSSTDQSFLDRLKNTVSGGLKGSGANSVNATGAMFQFGQGARDKANEDLLTEYNANLERAKRDLEAMRTANAEKAGSFSDRDLQSQMHVIEDWQRKYDAMNRVVTEQVQQKATAETYKLADQIQQSAEKDTAKAKEGASAVGATLVDVGTAGTQLLGDIATGAVTGVGTMPAIFIRGFGAGTQQARQNGATYEEQLAYGLGTATVEALTEKIASVGSIATKYVTKGALDDVAKGVVKAVEDHAKTKAGKVALNRLASIGAGFVGEGFEEAIAAYADPILQKLTYDKSGEKIDWEQVGKDAAYQFLVGGILGGAMGGIGGTDTRSVKAPETKTEKPAEAAVSPAADPAVQQVQAQAEVTQAQNPEAEVLDAATTLFTQQGMNLKTAQTRAEIVGKLIRGEEVSDKDLNRIDPTSNQTKQIFTQLTGVQFPEGKIQIEKLRDLYRSAHAVAEAAKVTLEEQAVSEIQPMSDEQILERAKQARSAANPEAEAQAAQILAQARGEIAPDGNPMLNYKDFAARHKQVFPDASPQETARMYDRYLKENQTVSFMGRHMTRQQVLNTLNSAPGVERLTAEERAQIEADLNAKFDAELEAQKRDGKDAVEHSDRRRRTEEREKVQRSVNDWKKVLTNNSSVKDIVLDESLEENEAAFITPDGVIHLNAKRMTSEADVAYVLGHELVHSIDDSTARKTMVNDIIDTVRKITEPTESREDAIERYRKMYQEHENQVAARANREAKTISFEYAEEEYAADLMREVFLSGDMLNKLAAEKPSLMARIQEILQKWIASLKGNNEAVELYNELTALQDRFVQALRSDAAQQKLALENAGIQVDTETESARHDRFSLDTWLDSDYMTDPENAAKALAKAIGVSDQKAAKYIKDVNGVAKLIADNKTLLDYEAAPRMSSFVSNTEYGGSIDFSTICKKRRLFTGTFTAIQKALPNTALTSDEMIDIRKRMKDAGHEVSCGLCYVEGSRLNLGQYATEFLDKYTAEDHDFVPAIADLTTVEGQENLRLEHPEVYEAYIGYLNTLAQRKPKVYQTATAYDGEILKKFGKDTKVEEKNKNGGLRLQSFSDFEIIHLIDNMQVIMDMARVGLAGQAYTKVPDFAWAMGNTGLKINLSLIAKDVDADGNLVFDDVEGMPHAEAKRLRDAYSDNVGTIIVVFNDAQLKAAMADDFIDYIIPFHRSQLNQKQYDGLGLPKGTKNYTMVQNESYIEPVLNKNGKKTRPENYMPNKYWDFNKSGKENAEDYLKMCAENNRRPKFSHVLEYNGDGSYSLPADGSADGYWKLLIDFKMYNNDGVGVPQQPVKPEFNLDEANRMLSEYKGGHSNFPVAQDIVDEFVADYKKNHPDARYSIAGENATGANKVTQAGAKVASALGVGPRGTAQQFGWWKGADGKWRFEVDDSGMEIRSTWKNATTMGEMIKHTELFKRYPALRRTPVKIEKMGAGQAGGLDPTTFTFYISTETPESELKETLLHEMQHWIQHYEGFAVGDTPMRSYQNLFLEAYDRIKNTNVFQNLKSYDDRVHEIEREIIRHEGGNPSAKDLKPGLKKAALAEYYRSTGEEEAYTVEDRAEMTYDERRADPPGVPNTKAITTKSYKGQARTSFLDLHTALGWNGVDPVLRSDYNNRILRDKEARYAPEDHTGERALHDGAPSDRRDSSRDQSASGGSQKRSEAGYMAPQNDAKTEETVTQASEKSDASSLPKYSITPQFEKWYKETYGTDLTSAQLKRRLQTAERRAAEAEHDKKAAELKNTIDSEMDLTAWMIHHTKKMREQKRVMNTKLDEARKAKAEAVRTAVSETKVVERAKAEVQHDADRMAERRNAAKRLRTQENAYTNKVTELKENAKLKRNAAKATLRDSRLAAKKRAEIEAEQGLVDTIRKNPAERAALEKELSLAEKLRVWGRDKYAKFVSQAASIERFGKRQTEGIRADTLVNIVGASLSTVETTFKTGLVDRAGNRIGDSMSDVFLCWDEAHKKVNEGQQALLQDFMLHWHNIDRMSIVARAESALETFELNHEWLRDMDQKEFARLVAMTEKEVEKQGKHEAQQQAFEYVRLIRAYNEAQNKPIFADDKGNSVTAETSQRIVDQYLEEHPWLLEKANGIYEWWDRFMREWAVGDTISEAEYERMHTMYPHYVPTYRADKNGVGGANFVGARGATVSKAVKKAKGSHSEVMNIEDSFSNIVSKIIRLNRVNELYMNIIDTAMLDNDGLFSDMVYFDWDSSWQSGEYGKALLDGELTETVDDAVTAGLEDLGDGEFKLTGWLDGRKYTAFISKDLYKSIGNVTGYLESENEKLFIKAGNTLTGPMKSMITGYNPFFAIRNLVRDYSTGCINSISGLAFPKYYARAWKEMAKGTDHWQTFKALGGTHATYYNNNSGFGDAMSQTDGVIGKTKNALGFVNNNTESATRFAEYLATIDRLGDTYENRLKGIKNSAEVTVDFSRKGSLGKGINAWVSYWNPAVQGIDKTIRSLIDSPDGSAIWKQASRTLGRAAMSTVLWEAVQYALLAYLDRDDEWEELDDRTKDTYYCIPLRKSKTFLKVPKNREWGAILGASFSRMLQWAGGREDPFENYIETCLEPNFLPPALLRLDEDGGLTSDILGVSQALDLQSNKDFAGRTIVPYAYQQGTKKNAYDADTSVFSIALGQLIGKYLSPMQIDYIISDYCGDFGDLFILATAKSSWAGEGNAAEKLLKMVRNPFIADARYSNYDVNSYYELTKELGKVVQDKKNQLGNEKYEETIEYQTQKALDIMYGDQISELNRYVRDLPDGDEKDAVKAQIAQLAGDATEFYEDSMAGKVSNPIRTAEYHDFSETVSKELIRMDAFSGDYKFVPYDVPKSKYNDPDDEKNREYILTDEQKAYFKQLYREKYNEIFEDLIQSSKYKKKKDSEKAELLEDARADVLDATKEEFFEWLDDTGVRSTKKQK